MLLLALLALSSCGAAMNPGESAGSGTIGETKVIPSNETTTPAAEPIETPPELYDTEWMLTSLRGRAPRSLEETTLKISDGELGGEAACNLYGADFEATRDGELDIGLVESTAIGCLGPRNRDERQYFDSLENATSYRRSKNSLEMLGPEGEVALIFAENESRSLDPGDLIGTEWIFESMNSESVVEGSRVTISFSSGGRIEGDTGCGEYRGAYEADGENVRFDWIESGVTGCPGRERLLYQEREYVSALENASGYELRPNRLEIYSDAVGTLTFAPAG